MNDDLISDEPRDHVTVDELSAMADGELAPAEAARVRSHLDTCSQCSGLAARVGSVVDLLEEWSTAREHEPAGAPPERKAAAIAAALAASDAEADVTPSTRRHGRGRMAVAAMAALAALGALSGGTFALLHGRSSSSGSPAANQFTAPGARGGGQSSATTAKHALPGRAALRVDLGRAPCSSPGAMRIAGRASCVRTGADLAVITRAADRLGTVRHAEGTGTVTVDVALADRIAVNRQAVLVVDSEVVGTVSAHKASQHLVVSGVKPAGLALIRSVLTMEP